MTAFRAVIGWSFFFICRGESEGVSSMFLSAHCWDPNDPNSLPTHDDQGWQNMRAWILYIYAVFQVSIENQFSTLIYVENILHSLHF